MKKAVYSGLIAVLCSVTCAQMAAAQLIDYNRRNKTQQAAPAAKAPTVRMQPETTAAATTKVLTRQERRYDLNGDGVLQSDEVIMLLKDVVDGVEKDGRYVVNSDVLKQYDSNDDGYISKYEAAAIMKVIK